MTMDEIVMKSSNNDFFEVKLMLIVNYNLEYLECLVVLHNKFNNKNQLKQFEANKFRDALRYYTQQEAMFIKA